MRTHQANNKLKIRLGVIFDSLALGGPSRHKGLAVCTAVQWQDGLVSVSHLERNKKPAPVPPGAGTGTAGAAGQASPPHRRAHRALPHYGTGLPVPGKQHDYCRAS